jgi:hypothetical protein
MIYNCVGAFPRHVRRYRSFVNGVSADADSSCISRHLIISADQQCLSWMKRTANPTHLDPVLALERPKLLFLPLVVLHQTLQDLLDTRIIRLKRRRDVFHGALDECAADEAVAWSCRFRGDERFQCGEDESASSATCTSHYSNTSSP